ncbi:MAG: ferrous iron transport protein A [Lachnospiraceae bacterium]|nr:ferrous iron transport protein A [Lachnospiraceae bacterium]
MEPSCNLSQLCPGERAEVLRLRTAGTMRRRLMDLGLIEHTEVVCLGKSPSGDPSAYLIRGAAIAIRARDSRQILIKIKPT